MTGRSEANRRPRRHVSTPQVVHALRQGDEPDPRFSLANERTYLSWIRTALGLVAAGVALEAFGDRAVPDHLRTVLVTAALGFAGVLSISALMRWWRVQVALRRRQPLPLPWMAPVMSLLFLGIVIALIWHVFS